MRANAFFFYRSLPDLWYTSSPCDRASSRCVRGLTHKVTRRGPIGPVDRSLIEGWLSNDSASAAESSSLIGLISE